MNLSSIDFFGLKISVFKKNELINYINNSILKNQKKVCFGYSLGYISLFKYYPTLYAYVRNYDIMVADGRYFYLFAKLLGAPIKTDLSIPFLSKLLFELANKKGYSIMLIGSSKVTNRFATEYLRRKYPGATVYDGFHGGDFNYEQQEEIIHRINKNKPDMLFIGISSPKKEEFVTKWKDELNTKIIVPFGGMIDGLAGKVWLTPLVLKKLGFATLIRVIQEPKRLLLSRVWMTVEILFRIIPLTVYQVSLRKNNEFFIPSIYKIKKE